MVAALAESVWSIVCLMDAGRRRPSWARCVRRASWPRCASKERSTARCSRPGSSSISVKVLRPGDMVVMDNLSSHKGSGCGRCHRSRRRRGALPAALFARSQSDRTGLQQVQKTAPRRRRADQRKTLATLRNCPRLIHRNRMPKLHHTLRIPLYLDDERISGGKRTILTVLRCKWNSPQRTGRWRAEPRY